MENAGQAPFVVYDIKYDAPGPPFDTLPEIGSITAASIGGVSKSNIPPMVPVTLAVPPSHPDISVKEGSSVVKEITKAVI